MCSIQGPYPVKQIEAGAQRGDVALHPRRAEPVAAPGTERMQGAVRKKVGWRSALEGAAGFGGASASELGGDSVVVGFKVVVVACTDAYAARITMSKGRSAGVEDRQAS